MAARNRCRPKYSGPCRQRPRSLCCNSSGSWVNLTGIRLINIKTEVFISGELMVELMGQQVVYDLVAVIDQAGEQGAGHYTTGWAGFSVEGSRISRSAMRPMGSWASRGSMGGGRVAIGAQLAGALDVLGYHP